MEHEFNEVQRFRIWWAWLGVAALNILFLYAIVQQLILGKPFGEKPAPDFVLILIELLLLALLYFLVSIRLYTKINAGGIYYRFHPFHRRERFISWNELSEAYMRPYNSLLEYGGWGIRVGSPKTGNAINTSQSANRGLQLRFREGRLLLIGTAKPDELERFLEQINTAAKLKIS